MTNQETYITITGFKHYYDLTPFKIGRLIRCKKQPDNVYDDEAIRCTLPGVGTVGYIANSPSTAANGTKSAGRIYDTIPEKFYVRVCFTTFTKVICRIETEDAEALMRELQVQMDEDDEWDD